MGYCGSDDIAASISLANTIQLTDDDGIKVINSARLNAAIAAADEIINGYLRGRNTVPLNPVPGLIRGISVDITTFKLYERRFTTELPQSIQQRYDNAVKLLREIQSGAVVLDIAVPASPASGCFTGNKTASDREFSKDVLKGF
ncbi:MAG: DUF1320 domain-containing protein [Nitrospirae bacterium]|nr:DUF1320 domain-containing protein [Nitrospirota bacterium]